MIRGVPICRPGCVVRSLRERGIEDRSRSERATVLGRAAVVFMIAALLAPIFAHGCHGGDEDHEPLAAPHRDRGQ